MAAWKEMVSDSRYEVSDAGEVRRKDTQRIRKPSTTPTGYKVIVLYTPGGKHRGVYVHREVMRAFVGECPEGREVSHLNGDNTDNRLVNLVYENRVANIRRKKSHGTQTFGAVHHSAKLTDADVKRIRFLSCGGFSGRQIAEVIGVSKSQINRILRGEHWSHVR